MSAISALRRPWATNCSTSSSRGVNPAGFERVEAAGAARAELARDRVPEHGARARRASRPAAAPISPRAHAVRRRPRARAPLRTHSRSRATAADGFGRSSGELQVRTGFVGGRPSTVARRAPRWRRQYVRARRRSHRASPRSRRATEHRVGHSSADGRVVADDRQASSALARSRPDRSERCCTGRSCRVRSLRLVERLEWIRVTAPRPQVVASVASAHARATGAVRELSQDEGRRLRGLLPAAPVWSSIDARQASRYCHQVSSPCSRAVGEGGLKRAGASPSNSRMRERAVDELEVHSTGCGLKAVPLGELDALDEFADTVGLPEQQLHRADVVQGANSRVHRRDLGRATIPLVPGDSGLDVLADSSLRHGASS